MCPGGQKTNPNNNVATMNCNCHLIHRTRIFQTEDDIRGANSLGGRAQDHLEAVPWKSTLKLLPLDLSLLGILEDCDPAKPGKLMG